MPSDIDLSEDFPLPETLDDLDFSVRTYNCLKREGVTTVGDLTALTEDDYFNMRNFGKRGLDEVKAKLAERGLRIRQPSWTATCAPSTTVNGEWQVVHEQVNIWHCGGVTVTVEPNGHVQLSRADYWPQDFEHLCGILDEIRQYKKSEDN